VSPETNSYATIEATAQAEVGAGSMLIPLRFCFGQAISGEIVGYIGSGGYSYEKWLGTMRLGFLGMALHALGVDVVTLWNTAVSATRLSRQADYELAVDWARSISSGVEASAAYVPMFNSDDDSWEINPDADEREDFRAAMAAKKIPYTDLVNARGRCTTQKIRGDMSDHIHGSSGGGRATFGALYAAEAAGALGGGGSRRGTRPFATGRRRSFMVR
jgi:hypothetical protein